MMAKEKSYLGEFTETLYRLERMAKDRDRWKDLAQRMGDELRNILRKRSIGHISTTTENNRDYEIDELLKELNDMETGK